MSLSTSLFLLAAVLVLLPTHSVAFGAGDIPDFAYLNGVHIQFKSQRSRLTRDRTTDKAYRHGDIENVLETLVKASGAAVAGGGFMSFANKALGGSGKKFTKNDIKKVYFVRGLPI